MDMYLCLKLKFDIVGCYTGIQAQENMTSSMPREFISVQDVERLSIGLQPNSTLVVVGQLSTKVSQEP